MTGSVARGSGGRNAAVGTLRGRGLPAQRMPERALTLLGGFRLTAADEVVELPIGIQHLVAVLALRGRMSRSRLAGSIWPETTEHRALASLRTGMWRLNQSSPGLVAVSGAAVDLGADVEVDVRRFVLAALAVMRRDPDVDGAVWLDQDWDVNELLPDWDDEWLLVDRERLRQLRLHMVEALAERFLEQGDYGLALEAALRSVRVDALRESAHRTVIRIHLAEGNVVEARRAYDACRDVLSREVGISPSPRTSQMLDAVGGDHEGLRRGRRRVPLVPARGSGHASRTVSTSTVTGASVSFATVSARGPPATQAARMPALATSSAPVTALAAPVSVPFIGVTVTAAGSPAAVRALSASSATSPSSGSSARSCSSAAPSLASSETDANAYDSCSSAAPTGSVGPPVTSTDALIHTLTMSAPSSPAAWCARLATLHRPRHPPVTTTSPGALTAR